MKSFIIYYVSIYDDDQYICYLLDVTVFQILIVYLNILLNLHIWILWYVSNYFVHNMNKFVFVCFIIWLFIPNFWCLYWYCTRCFMSWISDWYLQVWYVDYFSLHFYNSYLTCHHESMLACLLCNISLSFLFSFIFRMCRNELMMACVDTDMFVMLFFLNFLFYFTYLTCRHGWHVCYVTFFTFLFYITYLTCRHGSIPTCLLCYFF